MVGGQGMRAVRDIPLPKSRSSRYQRDVAADLNCAGPGCVASQAWTSTSGCLTRMPSHRIICTASICRDAIFILCHTNKRRTTARQTVDTRSLPATRAARPSG